MDDDETFLKTIARRPAPDGIDSSDEGAVEEGGNFASANGDTAGYVASLETLVRRPSKRRAAKSESGSGPAATSEHGGNSASLPASLLASLEYQDVAKKGQRHGEDVGIASGKKRKRSERDGGHDSGESGEMWQMKGRIRGKHARFEHDDGDVGVGNSARPGPEGILPMYRPFASGVIPPGASVEEATAPALLLKHQIFFGDRLRRVPIAQKARTFRTVGVEGGRGLDSNGVGRTSSSSRVDRQKLKAKGLGIAASRADKRSNAVLAKLMERRPKDKVRGTSKNEKRRKT